MIKKKGLPFLVIASRSGSWIQRAPPPFLLLLLRSTLRCDVYLFFFLPPLPPRPPPSLSLSVSPSLTRTVCPGERTAGVANDSGFLGRAGLNKRRMHHSLPAGPSVWRSVGRRRSHDVTFGSEAVILNGEFYHREMKDSYKCCTHM